MFWVVQDNIFGEENHDKLLDILHKKKIPFSEVKLLPFSDRLLPSFFDSDLYDGFIENVEEEYVDDTDLVMVVGSLSLSKIGKERGWVPGSFFNENFTYEVWSKHYQDYILNKNVVIDSFSNITPKWERFFLRPCKDSKIFDGSVFDKNEFLEWRNDELKTERYCEFSDDLVMMSPVQYIFEEYRFFVVDGNVTTGSQYKKDFKLYKNSKIDQIIIDFAQKVVDIWQPSRAFVIDICVVDDGFKVIEIGNFNSAGFYDSDIEKIVVAIENMNF